MLALACAGALAFAPLPSVHRAAAPAPSAVAMGMPKWQKPMVSALLVASLIGGLPDTANAARSGGRMGGRAPSMRSAPRAAPRMAAPSQMRSGSRTNVYVSPGMGMGMPMMGGMGMGYGGMGYGYGGGGGAGLYLGLSLAESLMREQQRQAFLQQQLKTQQELGRDQEAIQQLQRELSEQNAKVSSLQSQGQGGAPAPPPNAMSQEDEMAMLKRQLAAQQEMLLELKANAK